MKKLFVLVLIVLVAGSCEKSDLKKPTKVNFAFSLNKSFGPDSKLKIQSGTINLTDFDVTGDRVSGDDIAFNRKMTGEGLTTDLNGSGELDEMDFDLPQGDYTSIQLDFVLAPSAGAVALELEGTYKPSTGPPVSVRFEMNLEQHFSILAEDKDQTGHILLNKEEAKKVKIEFDPIYWFDILTVNQLDNADIIPQNGQDEMVISSTSNVSLYELVVPRIVSSNTAIF